MADNFTPAQVCAIFREEREREERIIERLAGLLDGGTWPVASAVKVLGGREILRRALEDIDG